MQVSKDLNLNSTASLNIKDYQSSKQDTEGASSHARWIPSENEMSPNR